MELGKIPPHDIEAEQAVIGSMLTDKDAIMSAVETLKPEDFYREDNKIIYEAILNLYNRFCEIFYSNEKLARRRKICTFYLYY